MDTTTYHGAFEVPDLWRPSLLTILESDSVSLFKDFDLSIHSYERKNPYATDKTLNGELQLPPLDDFRYGDGESLIGSEGSVVSTEVVEANDDSEEPENDPWLQIAEQTEVETRCTSWEQFNAAGVTYQSPYLSEWGPLAYNTALAKVAAEPSPSNAINQVVRSEVAFRALCELALGRSSVLYTWHDRARTFTSNHGVMACVGLSSQAFSSVSNLVLQHGTTMMRLRRYVRKTFTTSSLACKVALASAISALLSSIEASFVAKMPTLRSLLQVQNLMGRATKILKSILTMIVEVQKAETDEKVCSAIYTWCQKVSDESLWQAAVAYRLLSYTSAPFLERIACWVGLRTVTPTACLPHENLSFVARAASTDMDARISEPAIREAQLPAFITTQLGEVIAECGTGLQMLQSHHPDHAIVLERPLSNTSCLEWQRTWIDIDALLERARNHEADLCNAVRNYVPGVHRLPTASNHTPAPEELDAQHGDIDHDVFIDQSMWRFASCAPQSSLGDEGFCKLEFSHQDEHGVDVGCSSLSIRPPVEMLSELSFAPLLYAQARLIKGACMRTFFRWHDLHSHIRLQQSFHLMGDGVFVSRLSAALFDTTVATTEREAGIMRSGQGMGLKLGDRTNWPPASSELRLALMGILGECYQASRQSTTTSGQHDILGGLSFAIRNLAEDEVERVMQPRSLYALDFLRLQYSPPAPVNRVITPDSLEKYDGIFKVLLRLVRLSFVVSRLPRHGQRPATLLFCAQARHFVNTTTQHFFNTAIAEPWSAFDAHLHTIVAALDDEDARAEPTMRETASLADLRRRHDACLDQIRTGLLLRRRQHKVLMVLEEIYGLVLELDALCTSMMREPSAKIQPRVRVLYGKFSGRVVVFLDLCRGLAAKSGSDEGTGLADGMEHLIAAVDFNGFYASRMK